MEKAKKEVTIKDLERRIEKLEDWINDIESGYNRLIKKE